MKSIAAWETDDGGIFRSRDEAARHEFAKKWTDVLGEPAVAMVLTRSRDLLDDLLELEVDDTAAPPRRTVKNGAARPKSVTKQL